jgi:hypothetical protein
MSESVRDMLAREAAEAEERADAEERGEIVPAPGQRGRRRAVDPSQVYAVRIPVSRLHELREVADTLNVQPSALIRQWVIERLDAQDANDESQPPVSDGVKLGPRRMPVVHERESEQVKKGGRVKRGGQVKIRA